MEALLYFIIWAIVLFIVMHLGGDPRPVDDRCRTRSAIRGHDSAGNKALRWTPPEKDIDPVCGQTVHTASAKPTVHDGWVYYFCSRECREQFETFPEFYINKSNSSTIEHSEVPNA